MQLRCSTTAATIITCVAAKNICYFASGGKLSCIYAAAFMSDYMRVTGHSQVPYLCLGSSKCHTPAAATYFTSGNVNTIAAWCNAHGDDIHRVFVNAKLSGVQERNLERALGKPVIDRVGLIIGIFSQRAKTKEAQIQVRAAAPGFSSCCLLMAVAQPAG